MVDVYRGPLYHGTDRKILKMDKKGREERLALSKAVSEYLYSFLLSKNVALCAYSEEQLINKRKLKDIWEPLWNRGMIKYSAFKNNNQLYQYGCLYVSNDFFRAADYAKNGFVIGERGDVAYWLYKGAIRYDDYYENAPDMMKQLIRRFEEIIKEPPEPVVVVLENMKKQNIKNESGTEVDWDIFEEEYLRGKIIQSFRVINAQDYDLTKMKIINT